MEGFFDNVATIIEQARTYVGRTADLTMCITYYEIGRMIVEQEQNGKEHSEYGSGLLKKIIRIFNWPIWQRLFNYKLKIRKTILPNLCPFNSTIKFH